MTGIRQLSCVLAWLAAAGLMTSCANGGSSTLLDSAAGADESGASVPETNADAGDLGSPASAPSIPTTSAELSPATDPPPSLEADSATRPSDTVSGTRKGAATSGIDAAIASRDVCEVYAAMGSIAVSADDPKGLLHTLDLIVAALYASDDFVPEEIRDAWSAMERQLDRARSQLSKPGADVSEVAELFAARDYSDAQQAVDDWERANCA